ncbi:NAD(P)-binding protein [Punctularia strigosozonata HHB-11173 SS5]|uniref:NAD(P)-binding protein n=1 Tax=Punctularia strigosozonata (strain HHB-11173) TaxID=741275 RepID=UPI000441660D|nr:NAD(P)-binding protein [Punctularia strigosozonata HHB-11173 SS5]EIN13947.1 NAD(P)-binding protein [Punctularia strigosozonata HHB-11173 SS5]
MSIPEEYKQGWKPPFQKQQNVPGSQFKLDPPPLDDITADGKPYKASGKLEGRTALITGADSGIGRAIALLFALEGAQMTIAYTPQEEKEAKEVEERIRSKTGGKTKLHLIATDLRKECNCKDLIDKHLKFFSGALDALILNHGTQIANTDVVDLPTEQWHDTFDVNIHSFFYLTKAAIPHMPEGSSIVYDASINFAIGHPELLDYTATKGAMIGFMRAVSNQIVGEKKMRVNAVAPGPIWTPLIPATMTDDSIEQFGVGTPMGRAGQPIEVATCFVFLTSADSSYISGQVLHVNGGTVIN